MYTYNYLPPDVASGEYNKREGSKQSHEVHIRLYSPQFHFMLFHTFNLLKGSGVVDKIKKHHLDSLSEMSTPWPSVLTSPFGFGENRVSR